jgi:uncharacterized protein GlcG (DUF336 family)
MPLTTQEFNMSITLEAAQAVIGTALHYARQNDLQPLAIAVLDARGVLKAFAAEEGTGTGRGDIAMGKANGALSMGMGSRTLAKRAKDAPTFFSSLSNTVRGGLVPMAGGVLIRDPSGTLLGAIGISGDISDKDEVAALAGIEAAGLVGDPGSD